MSKFEISKLFNFLQPSNILKLFVTLLVSKFFKLMLVKEEQEEGKVAVRDRKEGDLGAMPVEEFIEKISKESI